MLLHESESELGKKSEYESNYNPSKLFAIPRKIKRDELGIQGALPFVGYDIWNHYEVSWLNEKGKPQVGVAEISYSCDSKYIIESKSMKLYFNTLNNSKFKDIDYVQQLIENDISLKIDAKAIVKISPLNALKIDTFNILKGKNIDSLDVTIDDYTVNSNHLVTNEHHVEEEVCSDLLKSNCLITNQPDWGSIKIAYTGKQINHEGLLKYIISFRNHNEFHEQCVERIFLDIQRKCSPQKLMVQARYTRRGGLDINPVRSSYPIRPENIRHFRQ